jgi:hypothetical protein
MKAVDRRLAIRLRFYGIALGFKQPAERFLNSGIILDNQDAASRLGCRDWGGCSTHTEWHCEIPHKKPSNLCEEKPPDCIAPLRKHHGLFEAYNPLTIVLVKGFSF